MKVTAPPAAPPVLPRSTAPIVQQQQQLPVHHLQPQLQQQQQLHAHVAQQQQLFAEVVDRGRRLWRVTCDV